MRKKSSLVCLSSASSFASRRRRLSYPSRSAIKSNEIDPSCSRKAKKASTDDVQMEITRELSCKTISIYPALA